MQRSSRGEPAPNRDQRRSHEQCRCVQLRQQSRWNEIASMLIHVRM